MASTAFDRKRGGVMPPLMTVHSAGQSVASCDLSVLLFTDDGQLCVDELRRLDVFVRQVNPHDDQFAHDAFDLIVDMRNQGKTTDECAEAVEAMIVDTVSTVQDVAADGVCSAEVSTGQYASRSRKRLAYAAVACALLSMVVFFAIKEWAWVDQGIAATQNLVAPREHRVSSGDSISTIAQLYYGTASDEAVQRIYAANKGAVVDINKINVGDVLTIPPK